MNALSLKFDGHRVKVWRCAGKTILGIQVRQKRTTLGNNVASAHVGRHGAKVLKDWLERYLKETETP
jgi:hypothetical protein